MIACVTSSLSLKPAHGAQSLGAPLLQRDGNGGRAGRGTGLYHDGNAIAGWRGVGHAHVDLVHAGHHVGRRPGVLGADFEDTVVGALGEVEIAGAVERDALRREEVYRGGRFAVAGVGQLAMASDRVHHVGLCGRQRFSRLNEPLSICRGPGATMLPQYY